MRSHHVRLLLVAALVVVFSGALTAAVLAQRGSGSSDRTMTVTLRDATNRSVGTVRLTETARFGTVDVEARLRRLEPGFHGFHVHAVGRCERPSFMSAGGHLKRGDQDHGDHIGDLSSVLVKRNGTATLRVTTDRFSFRDLRDADGSAVMVHEKPDNFGNIPLRYSPSGPDQMTRDTGDSGDRAACGVVEGRE
jgi:Cu-Zn family superoxide dismutase